MQQSSAAGAPAPQADAPGPLDGVRVLDFTMFLSGPYGTRLLADMGAEANKIEPLTGDQLGMGYKAVSELNPGIIFCSISGFGLQGPWAQRAHSGRAP